MSLKVTWSIPASVQACGFLTPANELVALLSSADLGTGGANCLKTVSTVGMNVIYLHTKITGNR